MIASRRRQLHTIDLVASQSTFATTTRSASLLYKVPTTRSWQLVCVLRLPPSQAFQHTPHMSSAAHSSRRRQLSSTKTLQTKNMARVKLLRASSSARKVVNCPWSISQLVLPGNATHPSCFLRSATFGNLCPNLMTLQLLPSPPTTSASPKRPTSPP